MVSNYKVIKPNVHKLVPEVIFQIYFFLFFSRMNVELWLSKKEKKTIELKSV